MKGAGMGGVTVERRFFCFICPYLLTDVGRCGKNRHLITVEQGYHNILMSWAICSSRTFSKVVFAAEHSQK